jgi:hypothetical protein
VSCFCTLNEAGVGSAVTCIANSGVYVFAAYVLAGEWVAASATIVGTAIAKMAPTELKANARRLAFVLVLAVASVPATDMRVWPVHSNATAYAGMVGGCIWLFMALPTNDTLRIGVACVVAIVVVIITSLGGIGGNVFYLSAPLLTLAMRAQTRDVVVPTAVLITSTNQSSSLRRDVVVYLAAWGVTVAFVCTRFETFLCAVQWLAALFPLL